MWKYNEIYTNICGNMGIFTLVNKLWNSQIELQNFLQFYIARNDALGYHLTKCCCNCCTQCDNMNKTVNNLLTGADKQASSLRMSLDGKIN